MDHESYESGLPAYMPLTVGDLLSTAARAATENIVPFFVIAAICLAPAHAVEMVVEHLWGPLDENVSGVGAVAHLGSFLVSTLTNALGQAALVYGTVEFLAGRRADFATSVQKGLSCVGPVFMLAILMTIGMVFGAMACLVPGVILMCGWFVAVPAAVIEHLGPFDALRRSWDLTEGRRGTVFGFLLVAFVALWGVAFVAMIALAGVTISQGESLAVTIGLRVFLFMFGTLWLIVQATAAASFYAKVRGTRDQIDADALAEVFR